MDDRMNDEQTRREHVRRAVELGTLPLRPPGRCWGGYGNGEPCLICNAVIPPSEVALEIELELTDGGAVARHCLHVPCFGAWEREGSRQTADPSALDVPPEQALMASVPQGARGRLESSA
jgi:hypothetical protein